MNIESKLLNLLKANQAEFALEALRRPQDRDTFEYGYRVGVVAGYEAAMDVLLNLLDEDKNGNFDL
jgi:hypothetical protein|tara:strand:- start:937 stop:1134 length:198 start_codon:yes stop_codon:yes gene_type:complete